MLALSAQLVSAKKNKLPKFAADFVEQSVPVTMMPGQPYNVSVTMKNTGARSWSTGTVKLVSQNPSGNTTWGVGQVAMTTSSAGPGQQSTFGFSVTSPIALGDYNFQWRLTQSGSAFGNLSANAVVSVTTPSPSPPPSPSPSPSPTPSATPTPSPSPSTGRVTVYIAHLRAQSAGATGSGTALLRLAADEGSATVSFNYSNLSSSVTGVHIHGPANPGQSAGILFDVDAAPLRPDGTYLWTFVPVGTNSVADIVGAIKAGRTYLNVHTTTNPTGEITGFFNLSGGSQNVPVPTPPPPLPTGTPTAEDAGRFLNQCSSGATTSLVQKVQQIGFSAFLDEQFAMPATSHLAFLDRQSVQPPGQQQTKDAWWTITVTAPDQVRQRLAFALSEILVVSFNNGTLFDEGVGMSAYYDILANDCFGNYRQLLQDVSLSPTMGIYLDMLGSDVADPSTGSHPNENYARELMQLFTIGLYRLNIDGSIAADADGSPIPTYNQAAVSGLAAALTGWTFAGSNDFYNPTRNYRSPMASSPAHHTPEAKSILDGVTIPAGQSPEQDLQQALDAIFANPNVGRFIARELIQRLVTSNPSPGYLYRVAAVFDDNGQGIRGDLKAVTKAILLDYDARGASKIGQGAGKEKEPILRLTSLYRAIPSHPVNGLFSIYLNPEFGEDPLTSPTVFNFFSPDYVAPGAVALAGLTSPELQITTETTVVEQANTIFAALFYQDIPLDFTQELALAGDPAGLVDHLNLLFMNGAMSSGMRTVLIDTITQLPADDPPERVQSALWLVLNSPEFVMEK